MSLRRFMHRKEKDADLAQEIEAHLAHEQDANLARGLSPEEARRQARLKFGNPETGVIVSGYLGLILLATVFVAVGLLTSSLTENQIIAAVIGLVATLLLYIIGWPAETAGDVLGPLLRYLSVTEHFAEMVRGIINTRSLIYFLSLISLALFLTQRSVESLRWR